MSGPWLRKGISTVNIASKVVPAAGFLPLAARSDRPLVPSLERRRLQVYALQMAADYASICVAFLLANGLYLGDFLSREAMTGAQIVLPIFVTIALYQGVYCQRALNDLQFAIRRTALALCISAALLTFLGFYVKPAEPFSRGVFSIGFALSLVLMALTRIMVSRAVRLWFGPTVLNVLIVDAGGPDIVLDHAYRLQADEYELLIDAPDPSALDRLGRCIQNMDRVIISCPIERQRAWSFALRAAGANAELVSEPLHEIGAIGIVREEQFSSIAVSSGPLGIRARAAKRLFDLAIAVPAIVLLATPMLMIALAIRMEDGGPVFFRQRRLGRGNRFFEVLKFRSMRAQQADASGNRSASRDDDRITRVGRLLRKTSLDELPQLLNVLAGEMSLVGPRPHAIGSQAGEKLFWQVDVEYWRRHALKPGMTGLAQVRGFRGATDRESDLTDRLQADLEYISNWSMLGDLMILLATFKVLIHDRAF